MRFVMFNWRDPKNPLAGGAERVTQGYLNALAERGHEVFWFANDFPGAAREEKIGPIQIIRGGGMGTSVLAARKWYQQQARFDLVMDQHHGIPWYTPWWCGTNNVSYIHEVLGPIWESFYRWPLSSVGKFQERWTHWLYRKVPFWTASSFTREQLLRHGVKDVTLIPYGVHTVALAELPPKTLSAPVKLISVSRLAPNKRIDHAIRTVAELTNLGVAAELTVVGEGAEDANLRQLTATLQLNAKVRFTGPLDEAAKDEALRGAHFLLHCSQREGWGLNVIEANAMGTPAVVYPVPGLLESTLHNETGLVAKGESPGAMAAEIAGSLKKPERYQTWRIKGWERAKTFHWNQVLPRACDWLEAQARKPRPT
jgi:glycosyltransferase involved in cell wall biosynthesis